MNPEVEVSRLLKADGAVLKREKNHEVWKLSNGNTFVRAKTPSDANGSLNNLADLKKAMGVVDPERGKPGERRERKVKADRTVRQSLTAPTVNGSLQEQLRLAGVAEDALQHQIEHLSMMLDVSEVRRRWLSEDIEELLKERRQCWWCRLRLWLGFSVLPDLKPTPTGLANSAPSAEDKSPPEGKV